MFHNEYFILFVGCVVIFSSYYVFTELTVALVSLFLILVRLFHSSTCETQLMEH